MLNFNRPQSSREKKEIVELLDVGDTTKRAEATVIFILVIPHLSPTHRFSNALFVFVAPIEESDDMIACCAGGLPLPSLSDSELTVRD